MLRLLLLLLRLLFLGLVLDSHLALELRELLFKGVDALFHFRVVRRRRSGPETGEKRSRHESVPQPHSSPSLMVHTHSFVAGHSARGSREQAPYQPEGNSPEGLARGLEGASAKSRGRPRERS